MTKGPTPRQLAREQNIGRIKALALQQLADVIAKTDSPLPGLRQVMTAGEQPQVTPQLTEAFRRLSAQTGGTTLHNQYGPSETHVITELFLDGPFTPYGFE